MSVVEPIARGSEYRCITDFETALVEWESNYGHEFRVGSSETLKNTQGMKDEVFEYRVLVLQCIHFGNPRERGNGNKRKRSSSANLPCGCSAMLRLNFSVKEQLLRITSLIDVHTGHELRPGQPDFRKKFSEKRRSAKRARLSDIGVSPASPAVAENLDFGVKPKIPFPMMSALAIHNSAEGKLLTKEIYAFFETYFPFFRTAYGSWKNSVRHALHTHMYFEKAMGPNKDKENLMFSITNFEKFQKDVEAFVERYPVRSKQIYGLSNPELWDVMEKGELKNQTIAIHRPKVVFPKKSEQKDVPKEDKNPLVIVNSSVANPMRAGDSNIVAPGPRPYSACPVDQKVQMNQLPMASISYLPQVDLSMPMPSLPPHFNPQNPLQYPVLPPPGFHNHQGVYALAQAASTFNYNDIRQL